MIPHRTTPPRSRRGAPASLLVPWFVLVVVGFAVGASPVAVVDDLGRDVRLAAPAARVVSLVPSHTETVCALGACDRLVGRDTWSDHPSSVLALPAVGSAFAPDLEAIVALRPDLVLVDEYSGAHEVLERLGLVVYAGTPQRLDEVFEVIERLGTLLGADTQAAVLGGRLRGELAGVAAVVAGRARPTVFYEIDPSPYSVGPAGYLGALIALAGADNVVAAGLGDFPLIDPEYVGAADPQVIVLADAPYGVDLAALRARPGWAGIAAVRSGRVIEVTAEQGDVLSRAGPRLGEAALLLARWFHPGAF